MSHQYNNRYCSRIQSVYECGVWVWRKCVVPAFFGVCGLLWVSKMRENLPQPFLAWVYHCIMCDAVEGCMTKLYGYVCGMWRILCETSIWCVVQYTEYKLWCQECGDNACPGSGRSLLYVWYNIQNMWRLCARNAGIIPVQEVAALFSTCGTIYSTVYVACARNAGIIPVQDVAGLSFTCRTIYCTIYVACARNARRIPVQEVAGLSSTCRTIYCTIYVACARNARRIPVQEVAGLSALHGNYLFVTQQLKTLQNIFFLSSHSYIGWVSTVYMYCTYPTKSNGEESRNAL